MKINVVRDKSGSVVATFEQVAGNGPKLEPVLPLDHKVEQMEVQEGYLSKLDAIYARKPKA